MSKAMRVWALACVLALAFGFTAAAQKANSVAGKWEMSWEGRQGPQTATLTFEQDGEKLKGTMSGQQGRETPFEGTLKGREITFTVKRETPRGEFTVTYKGTVDGDTMKGTADMGQRTIDWTAKRAK